MRQPSTSFVQPSVNAYNEVLRKVTGKVNYEPGQEIVYLNKKSQVIHAVIARVSNRVLELVDNGTSDFCLFVFDNECIPRYMYLEAIENLC